jgi:hypothetical protein
MDVVILTVQLVRNGQGMQGRNLPLVLALSFLRPLLTSKLLP